MLKSDKIICTNKEEKNDILSKNIPKTCIKIINDKQDITSIFMKYEKDIEKFEYIDESFDFKLRLKEYLSFNCPVLKEKVDDIFYAYGIAYLANSNETIKLSNYINNDILNKLKNYQLKRKVKNNKRT